MIRRALTIAASAVSIVMIGTAAELSWRARAIRAELRLAMLEVERLEQRARGAGLTAEEQAAALHLLRVHERLNLHTAPVLRKLLAHASIVPQTGAAS